MLVWSSCDGQYLDPWGAKPWGQIYNPDGTIKTGLLLLADSPPGYAPFIHVAWSTHDENYYAAWGDSRDCTPCIGPRNVYVQKISPEGNLLGANYIVNDVVGSLVGTYAVDIAVSRDRACIIWQDKSNYAVYPDGEMFGEVVSLDLVGTYLAGDVNMDYQCTSADVIYLVNYVFKSGQRPLPGKMFGDVNGDCVTTSADIIYYVNFVYKGGPGLVEACSN